MQDPTQEVLDRFRPPTSLEEAQLTFIKINMYCYGQVFGHDYVLDVYRRAVEENKSPGMIITAERNAEEQVYKCAAQAIFMGARLLAPNYLLEITEGGDGAEIVTATAISQKADDGSYSFFMSMLNRPGFGAFQANLEYQSYPPDSPRNDLYRVFWTALPPRKADGVMFCIIGIPKEDEHLAEAAAAVCGLKFSASELVQSIFADGELHSIPVAGKNLFQLTNTTGHPVYAAGTAGTPSFDELIKEDTAELRRVADLNGFTQPEV